MTIIGVELKKPPHHMIVFDPGKATGWCKFIDGVLDDWGICYSLESFTRFLQDYIPLHGMPDVVLYENFIVFKNKAQQQAGSKMEAPQAIGQIKLWAAMMEVKTESQMSSILPIAEKWSGVSMKGDHSKSHNKAALNHGFYWLVKNGMARPGGIEGDRYGK